MVHNTSAQSLDSSIESDSTTTNNNSEKHNEQGEALESNILTHARKSEKARRRTRGPYRKSHQGDK
jgi:hypothetical protein